MGLIRKTMSISSLGAVNFKSKGEMAEKTAKAQRRAAEARAAAARAEASTARTAAHAQASAARAQAAAGLRQQRAATADAKRRSASQAREHAARQAESERAARVADRFHVLLTTPGPPHLPVDPYCSGCGGPTKIATSSACGFCGQVLASAPRPSWLADPFGEARLRWFDGRSWTETVA